jgi:large subunit ribosomal protein L14e
MKVGQICKKIAGREKGRYCVVFKVDGKFAWITGIRKYKMCRRRRCNIKHLKPTRFKIEVESEKQEDIEKKLTSTGIITRLGLLKDKNLKKLKKKSKEEKKQKEKLKKSKEK